MRFCVDDGDYETHVDREPGVTHPDQWHEVLPLTEEPHEVPLRRLGCPGSFDDRIMVDVVRSRCEEVIDVLRGLAHIPLNIHRESRGLGDCQAEVQGNRTGNTTEADEEAPHRIEVW